MIIPKMENKKNTKKGGAGPPKVVKNKEKKPKVVKKKETASKTEKQKVQKLEKQVNTIKKELRDEGPKVQQNFKCEIWLTDVKGNQDDITKILVQQTNPLLAKSTNSASVLTPLGVKASQYEKWKLVDLTVNLKSLAGSAVTGTTCMIVITPSSAVEEGEENYESLLAKVHKEHSVGTSLRWKIPKTSLSASSQPGGWRDTSTNVGSDAGGPVVNIYTIGQAKNLYTGNAWDGPIFRVTLTAHYQFANYRPEPKQASLVKEQDVSTLTFETDADGDMIMKSNSASLNKCFSREIVVPGANGTKLGETIVQVGDVVAETAAAVTGPWGWLIKGGWWFVKKIFGYAGENAEQAYKVYPSWTAADKNHPCQGGPNTPVTLPNKTLSYSQLNDPNLGDSTPNSYRGSANNPVVTPGESLPIRELGVFDLPERACVSYTGFVATPTQLGILTSGNELRDKTNPDAQRTVQEIVFPTNSQPGGPFTITRELPTTLCPFLSDRQENGTTENPWPMLQGLGMFRSGVMTAEDYASQIAPLVGGKVPIIKLSSPQNSILVPITRASCNVLSKETTNDSWVQSSCREIKLYVLMQELNGKLVSATLMAARLNADAPIGSTKALWCIQQKTTAQPTVQQLMEKLTILEEALQKGHLEVLNPVLDWKVSPPSVDFDVLEDVDLVSSSDDE
uniref:Capsid protein n=1 Tax=Wenzhou pacific spadenose shark astrovirus 3 TaxID=2116147 RepID=A0A2P1GNT1_9VIRU|nr:capsid protein [Wenzhou pacific spadenose shark astrovirus 3]